MELKSLKVDEAESIPRAHFFNLVDLCKSEEDFYNFLLTISHLEPEALENALPSLCDFVSKCPSNLFPMIEDILMQVLKDPNSTRGGRKACYSCLKDIKLGKPNWNNFFIVAECLEEPQFHIIRPILPRVDDLLGAVSKNEFPWSWASIILIRALLHSNGWIRLWALEKAIEVDPRILAKNSTFIFEWLFDALDGNNLFWRLLERGHLEKFVQDFGQQLSQIVRASENPGILTAVEQLSCPVSFFFVAKALCCVTITGILNGEDMLPLIRRVLNRVSYIPYTSLRVTTCFLYVNFFARIVIRTSQLVSEFGSLTSFFSSEAPVFFQEILKTISSFWEEKCGVVCIQEIFEDHEEADFYKFFWKRAELSKQKKEISTTLLEKFQDYENEKQDSILRAILYSDEEICQDKIKELVNFIKVQLSSNSSLKYSTVENLYLPWINKYKPECLVELHQVFNQEPEKTMSTERLAVLSLILKAVGDTSTENLSVLVKKYFGKDLISTPKINRAGLSTKEYITLLSKIQTSRICLYLKCPRLSSSTAEEIVEECINQLDCASSYSVKEALLTVIAGRISEVTDASLLLTAVNAAACVVNEEKKSQNYLPAIEKLFEISFKKSLLIVEEVESREIFEELFSTASLSYSVALVLAQVLETAEDYLTAHWTTEVLTLAVFGPVPKKDNRVLGAAFGIIYREYQEALPNSDLERVHEVVQRTRIKAFSVAVRCSLRNPNFLSSIIKEIIKESIALDKTSSKSFGLSLAHRQKTRIVSLLLFIMEYVLQEDEATISAVFDHCISCILDPCQQFSIKLIVEWILVRMCLRLPNYREKLINMEKVLAAQRIGSVSSWINIMVHLSRAAGKQEITLSLINTILPWSTAQNFAVRCTAIAGLTLMYNSLSEDMKQCYHVVASIVNFDSESYGNSRRIIDNLTEDFYFAYLDMQNHLDLQTVLIELPTKTGLPHEETIPISLIQELNRTEFRSLNSDRQFLSAPSLVYAALLKNASCVPEFELEKEEETTSMESGSVQKKIITKERKKKEDCSLIVVASLIDKPNNLGGLCRTSEIFGVEELVLADLLMINDNGFKALSMSSEKWQKLNAVRPENLLHYLEKLKAEGYSVIAAEQTTDSIPLHKFQFPKKCVLLMGEEKEGVPTRLLRVVDQTVEIEQLGQTRSLNVHVTAALFIAKYAEQILL